MTSRRALPALLLLAATAVGIGAASGCGGLGATSAFSAAPGDNTPDASAEDGGTGGSGGPTLDAASSPPPVTGLRGSPLCGATPSTCFPDLGNDAGAEGTPNVSCGSLHDAGAADAAPSSDAGGYVGSDASYACHVVKHADGPSPECFAEGTSTGACLSSAQCVGGTECVGDVANLNGRCRQYCCEATDCNASSFCDVQPVAGPTSFFVPVCMPVKDCELLAQNQTLICPGQQCGLGLDNKQLDVKTCVDIGPRNVGEDCETDHCAKDLVCLGAPGLRKCVQLCDTKSTGAVHACPMGQVCRASGTTFKDGNVGICAND